MWEEDSPETKVLSIIVGMVITLGFAAAVITGVGCLSGDADGNSRANVEQVPSVPAGAGVAEVQELVQESLDRWNRAQARCDWEMIPNDRYNRHWAEWLVDDIGKGHYGEPGETADKVLVNKANRRIKHMESAYRDALKKCRASG